MFNYDYHYLMTLGILAVAALYLLALGLAAGCAPQRATRFLGQFAQSAKAHYTEMALRAAVGLALIVHAEHMRYSEAFVLIGWVITLTTALLLMVPWRWHQAIANRAVPLALRILPVLALCSVLAGVLLLYSLLSGT